MSDGDELEPLPAGLSGVAPTPSIKAVLRPGMRELPTSETADVFTKVFGRDGFGAE
jgi:hypothetical protein